MDKLKWGIIGCGVIAPWHADSVVASEYADLHAVCDVDVQKGQAFAERYGKIRTTLQQRGTPIGAMDLLIATHAVFLNAVLVTNNTREFERVPDLRIENWQATEDA